jgi:hypothetical protein
MPAAIYAVIILHPADCCKLEPGRFEGRADVEEELLRQLRDQARERASSRRRAQEAKRLSHTCNHRREPASPRVRKAGDDGRALDASA